MRIKSKPTSQPTESPSATSCRECLEQAEICREQACEAARLKRFRAACGLFSTAIALCRRAVTVGGEACGDARERLRQLHAELAIYKELARSMERPLRLPDAPSPLADHAKPKPLG